MRTGAVITVSVVAGVLAASLTAGLITGAQAGRAVSLTEMGNARPGHRFGRAGSRRPTTPPPPSATRPA